MSQYGQLEKKKAANIDYCNESMQYIKNILSKKYIK